MCGIAGFNVSPKWAEKYIDDEGTMFEICEKAWLHNLHRGRDAVGYMRFGLKDRAFHEFKTGEAADKFLQDPELKRRMQVSDVLAAHTRASTNGSEKDNRNNHPVTWGGVWVTHNGTITNHHAIKKKIKEKGGLTDAAVPDVDTVAIPMLLSAHKPWDFDGIIDALAQLDGGYAIHAVWEDNPGVSLIAKGRSSPLELWYHPHGAVVYGSEDDSVWQMISEMGLDPNDAGWYKRIAEDYTAVLVHEGTPVLWSSFKKKHYAVNAADEKYTRILKVGEKEYSVTDYDLKNDWVMKYPLSINDADPKKVDLVYTRDEGFINEQDAFPFQSNKFAARISEAEAVYQIKPGGMFHVVFGDVEIVFNEHGTLRDIYDHDFMKMEDRFEREEIVHDRVTQDIEDSWEQHMMKHTRENKFPPTESTEPKAFKRPPNYQNRGGGRGNARSPQTRIGGVSQSVPGYTGQRLGRTGRKYSGPYELVEHSAGKGHVEQEDNRLRIGLQVGWEQVFTLAEHPDYDMSWFKDLICAEHKEYYSAHKDPRSCPSCVVAALAVTSCVNDIEIMPILYPGDTSISYQYTLQSCSKECNWEMHRYERVDLHDTGSHILIPSGMRCVDCKNKRHVNRFPRWIEELCSITVYPIGDKERVES